MSSFNRMQSAFNTMFQAWQTARQTMWSTSTEPQDVVDAMGDYATDWFTLFADLRALMNEYVPVISELPDFVHGNYAVVENSDGTITLGGSYDASGV